MLCSLEMTHRFSEDEIQAALKDVTAEAKERARATRALSDWRKADSSVEITEHNIRLYLALRKLNPSGRVSLAQLKAQKSIAVSSTMVRNKIWLVPRSNFQTVPQEFLQFSIAPESLKNLPVDMDPTTIWAFDQAVPREKLGRGVLELEAKFGNMTIVKKENEGPSLGGSALPLPAPAHSVPETGLQEDVLPQGPPVKKPRVLQDHVSETEEESFERIAKATKEAGL